MGRKCAFCTHMNKHEKYKISHYSKNTERNIKSRYFHFNLKIILVMFVV
jgi:hypothetical protein